MMFASFGRGQKLGVEEAPKPRQTRRACRHWSALVSISMGDADVLTVRGEIMEGYGRVEIQDQARIIWDHPEATASSAGLHQKMRAAVGHAQGTECIRHFPKDHCPKFAQIVEIKVFNIVSRSLSFAIFIHDPCAAKGRCTLHISALHKVVVHCIEVVVPQVASVKLQVSPDVVLMISCALATASHL